jgi:hypothetical protein
MWLCEGFVLNTNKWCTFNGKYQNSEGKWYCGHHIRKPECTICLETCCKQDELKLQCGHVYHITCIQRWIKTGKFSCPLCRRELPPELDIPWFCLDSVKIPLGFNILPKHHFELYNANLISFATKCSLNYDVLMILQYEEPNLFWEYMNLVRYWVITQQAINTDIICDTIARRFKPFAVRYNLHEFMLVSFAIDINM